MNCDEANQIDLVDYLYSLGYQPEKIKNHDYWYLSPLREEKEASFKVTEMALNGSIVARTSEEERHFIRQLIGISNNLNQLTKKAHQEGLLTAVMHFEKYRNKIDELLEQLKQ
jgi:hypothetical protein